jgi:phage tail sheath protein FI
MPEYLAPGVYVEEIDGGSKPIEGVGVSTAAFVGYAKSGEFNKPTFISSWSDFCRIFGEEDEAILSALSREFGVDPVTLLTSKRTSRKTLVDFASDMIRVAAKADATKVPNWSKFVEKYNIPVDASPYMDDSYLAYAVKGFFDNDGSRAYIVRVARQRDIDLLKAAPAETPSKALPATTALGPFVFKALEAGKAGNDIKVDVAHVDGNNNDGFTIKVSGGGKSDSYGTKDKPLTPATAKDVISKSGKATVAEVKVASEVAERPQAGSFTLSGGADAVSADTALALPLHREIARVKADEFLGDEAKRSGIAGLSVVDDINFICAPDFMANAFRREVIDGVEGPEVMVLTDDRKQEILDAQALLVSYCERMGDRMCILDPLPELTPQEVRDIIVDERGCFTCERGQAAIYYPWVKVVDQINRPNGKRVQKLIPPCGHIAGVWARTAKNRGVHKAPANEALMGVVALEQEITRAEQEILNPNGINCIRAFPGTGIKVWGARTLATVGNQSWKYVNVRQLFNFLERSMDRGLQWVVFEPNDQDLWGRVRRTLSAFLLVQWREGKLFGSTPEEAFYVKCDSETNPQEMIDQGRLYVEVGINPVKPAEFVIVKIGQWTGGASITES